MKLGKRNLSKVFFSLFDRRHYIALVNMIVVYPDFLKIIYRYLLGGGNYPCALEVRTPGGKVTPKIYHYYDLLTVNEIFCRHDYGRQTDARVVIDIGANIGISALYFLSRNTQAKCYLYEPVPENVEKLNFNLKDYKDRIEVSAVAVDDRSGFCNFGVEATGRYGSLSDDSEKFIEVKCVEINEILKYVIEKNGHVDILKLDIEGTELRVLRAIKEEYLLKINTIYFESDCYSEAYLSLFIRDNFKQEKYGNVFSLKNYFLDTKGLSLR